MSCSTPLVADEPVKTYSLSEAERAELAERTEIHARQGNYWLLLTEAQAVDIASGYVPNAIRAMTRELLEFKEDLERKAARPVRKTRRRPEV